MAIAVYITVNLLLFSSWYIFLFRHKNNLSFADRLLGVFVLGLAQIIVTEMVLGVLFKKLYATPLFILNISISLVVFIISVCIKKPVPVTASEANRLRKNYSAYFYLTDIFAELRDETKRFFTILKSNWILMAVFILFFIYFCYLIFTGYLFPSYSWDALLYHLPTVGFILQSGAIENIPYNSLIYTFINIFPKNIDLFFLWNIIFLKSDIIVDLSQLFFTVAGMLAIYSITVKLKIKEKYAFFSSFLFFFAPIIILQSTTNYVDVAVSVLFLMSVNFLISGNLEELSLADDKSPAPGKRNMQVFLAGLTAGVLLGSKGSGPVFVIALSTLFFISELKKRFYLNRKEYQDIIKTQFKIKNIILRYWAYFIIPVMLLGSYWYIQNWINYDNPVYPFIVKLFGKTLFKGMFPGFLQAGQDILNEIPPLARPFYVWLEKVEHYFYASDLSGFGPLWFILLLPCTVLSVFLSIWKKRFNFLVIALMILLVFLVYPSNWFTRYVVFLFGLGCLAFGEVLQFFDKRGKALQYLALVIAFYTLLTSNSPSVSPGKIKDFIYLPAKERTLARMEPFILNNTQRKNYGLWAWMSRNLSEGDTLAYNFTPDMLSPLWNSSFSNRIVFIKSGKFRQWLEKLEENRATYVLVLAKPRTLEYFWLSRLRELRSDPGWSAMYNRFSLAYNDSNYAVFRFQK